MKQLFLTFDQWWNEVGLKRSKSEALDDINMLEFDEIWFETDTDEYTVNVRMKDKYRKNYMINKYLVQNHLVIMENIHLIHWAEWLNIGITVALHPELAEYFMLVTRVDIKLREPTFVDQPIEYKMELLSEVHELTKHELKFVNKISSWVTIEVDYTIMELQFEVLKHYHDKHTI